MIRNTQHHVDSGIIASLLWWSQFEKRYVSHLNSWFLISSIKSTLLNWRVQIMICYDQTEEVELHNVQSLRLRFSVVHMIPVNYFSLFRKLARSAVISHITRTTPNIFYLWSNAKLPPRQQLIEWHSAK